MSDEPPLSFENEPPPSPPRPTEDEPFWNYYDVAVFAGTAIPCILLGYGVVKLLLWIFQVKLYSDAAVLLPAA